MKTIPVPIQVPMWRCSDGKVCESEDEAREHERWLAWLALCQEFSIDSFDAEAMWRRRAEFLDLAVSVSPDTKGASSSQARRRDIERIMRNPYPISDRRAWMTLASIRTELNATDAEMASVKQALHAMINDGTVRYAEDATGPEYVLIRPTVEPDER